MKFKQSVNENTTVLSNRTQYLIGALISLLMVIGYLAISAPREVEAPPPAEQSAPPTGQSVPPAEQSAPTAEQSTPPPEPSAPPSEQTELAVKPEAEAKQEAEPEPEPEPVSVEDEVTP